MSVKNLGRVRLVYKGTWSNSTAYKRMDIVYKNGNAYYALVDNSAKDPELGANSSIWGILNRRGSVVQLNSPSVSVLTPKSNPTATTVSEGPDGIDKKITFGLPRAPKPKPTGYHVINPDQFPSVTQEIDSNGDFSFTFYLPDAPNVDLKSQSTVTRMPNQDPLVTATKTNGNVALQFEIPRSALVGLGTLSTLNPNQNPAITRTVDANGDVLFNFSIPRAATISLGTFTKLNPNQDPVITRTVAASGDVSFNFSLPRAASINLNSTPSITVNPNQSPAVRSTSTNGNITLQFDLPRSPLLNLGTTGVLNPNQNPSVARSVSATGDITYTFSLPKAAATTLGTVSLLNPNQNPTLSNTGTNGNLQLNFGLPKAATVSVGSTSTGNIGTAAIVTNTGTNGNVVLNFTIPKGETGGAPKGAYPTLAALQAAFPTGDNGAIYVVTEDGQWYYYNNGWLPGGGYSTDNISALGVKINDLGDFYNGENVELALQEIGQVLTEWDCGVF